MQHSAVGRRVMDIERNIDVEGDCSFDSESQRERERCIGAQGRRGERGVKQRKIRHTRVQQKESGW